MSTKTVKGGVARRVVLAVTVLDRRYRVSSGAARRVPSRAAVIPSAIGKDNPPVIMQGSVEVQLLGFNDFHGNLQPPSGSSGSAWALSTPAGRSTSQTHVKKLEMANANSIAYAAVGHEPRPG